ncbi:MAG: UPF0104 family protein [Methanobrevibacter ruminantium]|uniref:UPF0104 family protein n=2 Tax=Methanobrevibacter ruminantium TaxID=83816 RepID=UPI0026E9DDC9|nr:UPF0104 family protein [Methanobrevibacter ruminantium]MCI5737657.1 UPF0104 family protein [Methanobrevibacter ruminantium]MDD6048660.1 UPF0104 family protein [Methanobrevibacter ruminantium]
MKNKKVLIFLLFGLAIMGVMLYFIGIDEVIEALKLSNLWLVLLAIAIQIFTYFLYTWRWNIINKTANMNLGIKKSLPMVLVSLAVNNITPSGRGGGEPVRAYLLAKEGHFKFEDAFATVIADRALDTFPFVLLAILTIIGIIFTFSLDIKLIAFLVIMVTLITVGVILLLYVCINEAFGVKLTSWIIKIVSRFYKKFNESNEKRIIEAVKTFQARMNALLRDKSILYYALPLSFVIWIFEILRVYVVFLAFGAKVSPIIIGEVFILASFVGMVPLLPGGLGAVDGIMILFYANAGITASLSAAATVVERLISFWMTTFIGLIFLTMFGTSVLDKAFALAGSRNEDKEDTKSIEESSKEEESIGDSDSNEEKAPLEVLEDKELEEEPVLEVLDDEEKEVLEEKVQTKNQFNKKSF